uniref:Uncharacterized protein n=1 Tax=Rhizophora mucronata TaxID=61149 RepID=A0A2P2KK90_RHIMU
MVVFQVQFPNQNATVIVACHSRSMCLKAFMNMRFSPIRTLTFQFYQSIYH